jgi:hypothetical protein
MTASEITNVIPAIWDRIAATRKSIINRDGFIHACYFEIQLNLDLLDSLNTDPKAVSAKSPAFVELVDSLEINAILTLLTGSDRGNYRRLVNLLNKNWKTAVSFEKEEDQPSDSAQGVLDALGFIARKIEALRRIAHISKIDETVFKTINLNTRLKNIKKALLEVQKPFKTIILHESKKIRNVL